MIYSLSVKNYLSIKDEVTISFEAARDTDLEKEHVVEITEGVRLLKFLILYGYNASGKSNVIQAFQFLRNFWFDVAENKDEEIDYKQFAFDDDIRNEPSEFKLVFYHEATKYTYYLKLYENVVMYEKLAFYPGVQPAIIFERHDQDGVSVIQFGNKIKVSPVAKEEISIRCLPNMSVFASYNQVNVKIEELHLAAEWMKINMMSKIEPDTSLQSYTNHQVSTSNEVKDYVLNYLQEADFNISNISTDTIEEKLSDEMLTLIKRSNIPKKELERLEKDKTVRRLQTSFSHLIDKNDSVTEFPLDFDEQSEGTKRIFGLSGAIYSALKQNAFLAIDEIESKLHPRLIEYVIEQFLRQSRQAQLLVATHYDNLFDEDDLLRKDNFWFTEKGQDGSTHLYPLSSFNGIGRISSLQKAYKYGKFGAVPNID
jgi:AAA15 family ATPase/GTPase